MDSNSRNASKWVSSRVVAADQGKRREPAVSGGIIRQTPPQPRSGGGAADGNTDVFHSQQHHHHHGNGNGTGNGTASNNSRAATTNTSPSMAPKKHSSAVGGGCGSGGYRRDNNTNSNDRFPPLSSAGAGGRAGAGGGGGGYSFPEPGSEVAPPQPRSVQRSAAAAAAAVPRTGSATPGGGGSHIPTPRHGAIHNHEAGANVTASSNNSSTAATQIVSGAGGGSVATRWAQLGGSGPGPGNITSNSIISGNSNTINTAGGSFTGSTGSPFSKSDLTGFGGSPIPGGLALNSGGDGTIPFLDGLTLGGGSGANFSSVHQQQQQLQQYAAMLMAAAGGGNNSPPQFAPPPPQAGPFGQTGMAGGGSNNITSGNGNGVASAAALRALLASGPAGGSSSHNHNTASGSSDFGGFPMMSHQQQQQQQQLDLAALFGELSGSPAGPPLPQLQSQQQQQQQQAVDLSEMLRAMLNDPEAGGGSGSDNVNTCGSPRNLNVNAMGQPSASSLQDMMGLLVGNVNDGSGSGYIDPNANANNAATEDRASLFAALAAPDGPYSPHQPLQQPSAAPNQFLDFSRAFRTGFNPSPPAQPAAPPPPPPPPTAPATDPITAALFSQLTGGPDMLSGSGIFAGTNGTTTAAAPAMMMRSTSLGSGSQLGAAGAAGGSFSGAHDLSERSLLLRSPDQHSRSFAGAAAAGVPQPRSGNLRDLFSELTQQPQQSQRTPSSSVGGGAAAPLTPLMMASEPDMQPLPPSVPAAAAAESAAAAAAAAASSVDPEVWPSLDTVAGRRPKTAAAASATAAGAATGRPMSMAQALAAGTRPGSGSGSGNGGGGSSGPSTGVWRQVATHGAPTPTAPTKDYTTTGNNNTAAATSSTGNSTPCLSAARPDRSPMIPAPASVAAAAAAAAAAVGTLSGGSGPMINTVMTPLLNSPYAPGKSSSSQPHTPHTSSAGMRLHRASLEAPNVTRTTFACVYRETPQSLRHREAALGNRARPAALSRAPSWPPATDVEVDRLLKAKGANKLLRHLTIISFSRQHVKGVQELFDAWARNGIPAPDMGFGAYYYYVKEKSDKQLCMKHNGRGATPGHGYGKCDFESRRPNSTCRYEHVCLFCRSKEHGWFEEGKCEGYQQLVNEVVEHGVVEEDVEVMLAAMAKSSSAWGH